MLVLVSGSSGVGKNTVLNEVFKKSKDVKPLVSFTTRNIRPGEINGVNYHFVDKPTFQKMKDEDKFFEVEEIHGNFYGCDTASIQNAVDSDYVFIKDLGVEGVVNLRKLLGRENVVTIFVDAPKDVLRERLISRGEKEIDLRLSRYDYEHTYISDYNYKVQNIDLQECVDEVWDIINQEKCKKKVVAKGDKGVSENELGN